MITCPGCARIFIPTADDPAVSMSKLGAGTWHYDCAMVAVGSVRVDGTAERARRALDAAAARPGPTLLEQLQAQTEPLTLLEQIERGLV